MPRSIQRQAIESVDKRIDQREAKRPRTGVVKRKHGSGVDLRIKGSPQLWRNVPVLGDIDKVSIEDEVTIEWLGQRPRVVGPGGSTGSKRSAGSRSAGSVYITDSGNYFSGGTVEDALAELAAAIRPLMDDSTAPGIVAPTTLTYDWQGRNLELWWVHSGEGAAVQDYRVRIYSEYGGTLYRTDFSMTTHYTYTFEANKSDATLADPQVYVEVAARDFSEPPRVSSTISLLCTNPVPDKPDGATETFEYDLVFEYEWPDNDDITQLIVQLEIE